MSEFKVGDKAWVQCRVIGVRDNSVHIYGGCGASWWMYPEHCRPVEPEQDDRPVEFKVGDRVVSWSGRQGVVEAINEIEGFPVTVRHSMREQVSYKLGGVKHDDRPVESANSPEIPDSSNEPMRAAFESSMAKRYDWYQGYFSRNENRYFDSSVEMAWQAFQAGAKYQPSQTDKPEPVKHFVIVNDQDGNQTLYVDGVLRDGDNTVYGCDIDQAAKGCAIRIESRDVDWAEDDWPRRLSDLGAEAKQPESSPLTPSPCMDGVDVDQFVEGIMEARGRASDPVNPSHYKQGGIECIDAIKAATGDGFVGYVWGNVLKYLWRWPKKGGIEDLKKARWYLDRLIQEVGE